MLHLQADSKSTQIMLLLGRRDWLDEQGCIGTSRSFVKGLFAFCTYLTCFEAELTITIHVICMLPPLNDDNFSWSQTQLT